MGRELTSVTYRHLCHAGTRVLTRTMGRAFRDTAVVQRRTQSPRSVMSCIGVRRIGPALRILGRSRGGG
jgi:hypothetical protein